MRRKKVQYLLTLNDVERNNKVVMDTHYVLVLVMLTFCFLQATDGLQPWLYPLVLGAIGLVPVYMEHSLWKTDRESVKIRYIAAIGFMVFYTAALFTSANNLVFLFVIPMIMVASVYNDTRYSLMISVTSIIESLLVVIIGAMTGLFGYAGRDSSVIQVVIMILIAVYSYQTSKTLDMNLGQKIKQIRKVSAHTENVAKYTEKEITEISHELESLNDSFRAVKTAMAEVVKGISSTAKASQDQLQQTEAIETQVDTVNASAGQITESMEQTLSHIETGNADMEKLIAQVEASVSNSTNAVEKLKTLNDHMKEMDSIIGLINNITFQTQILALNASIEAARAGEAGKGFAVVASQITEMSVKTQDATDKIATLIHNVTVAIKDVTDVINQMIEGIKEEQEGASHTSESFTFIQANTNSVNDNVTMLLNNLTRLTEANQSISSSVQTISAISEEVSSLASQTMHSEEKNAAILEHISGKMQNLLAVATSREDTV